MADRWDWREMTVKVKSDGFQLGTIDLNKGILPPVAGPLLPGADNVSVLAT